MGNTSTYGESDRNEALSVILIEKYCLKNNWKYRRVEKDNDIDGEVEIFDEEFSSTAKFVKVQLKTVSSSERFESSSEEFAFDVKVKFLHFCDLCDIPVLLCVYDIKKEKGYFLFVQKYIYTELETYNENWRNNDSTVRLKIKFDNLIGTNKSIDSFISISKNGISNISQLRKINNYQRYYSVLGQDDKSHGTALRTSIKIVVEKSLSQSKGAMLLLIKKINAYYFDKVYHRNKSLAETHKGKTYDVIYMFFYSSVNNSKLNLPFGRSLWINQNLVVSARPSFSLPDDEFESIKIYWDSYDVLADNLQSVVLTKGEYLHAADDKYESLVSRYQQIKIIVSQYGRKEISSEKLISEVTNKFKSFGNYTLVNMSGLPPNECSDVDIKLNGIDNYLDNIRIVVNDDGRDVQNKINCINMYSRSIEKDIDFYEFERSKVK